MVLKNWEQTGLLRAFDKEFQKQAMLDVVRIFGPGVDILEF